MVKESAVIDTVEETERDLIADLIAVHEDGIRRLPTSSDLRESFERALPFWQIALGPDSRHS